MLIPLAMRVRVTEKNANDLLRGLNLIFREFRTRGHDGREGVLNSQGIDTVFNQRTGK